MGEGGEGSTLQAWTSTAGISIQQGEPIGGAFQAGLLSAMLVVVIEVVNDRY